MRTPHLPKAAVTVVLIAIAGHARVAAQAPSAPCRPADTAAPTLVATARLASTASGRFNAKKAGSIALNHAFVYTIDKPGDPRHGKVSILLSATAIDASIRTAPDPENAIEADPRFSDSDTISLHMTASANLLMVATFRRANVSFIGDTENELAVDYSVRTPTRIEGHLFTRAPVTVDGDTYEVDLRFGVDVPGRTGIHRSR